MPSSPLRSFVLSMIFFFHFLGLNRSLNDVKHTILVLQKQLISTKTVLIYTHFAVGGKGAQMHIFILAPWKIPTSSKQNIFSDQQRKKHENIKTCCDLSDLSVQPIDEICLFSVMTVYNTRWKVLMQSRNNILIHEMYKRLVTFNTMEHPLGKETL